jgi:hypothetical protein
VLVTQRPRRRLGGRPLRVSGGSAGSFRTLRATGTVRAAGIVARTRHRFRARFIETSWRVRGAAHTIDALFPSWGRRRTRIVAVREDGGRVVLGRRPYADIAYLHVMSARSGYVVVPSRRVSARTLRTRRQSSAPLPGPTLALRPTGRRLAVRLAPARGAAEAAAVAARLRAE